MPEPVLWLGGWASDLACWRERLESLYPRRAHAFLDAHAVLEDPGLLARSAASLPREGTLVAWSLGSLLLHRALAQGGLQVDCGLISAAPIFDFCRPDGPWPPAVLARMARKLAGNRETVLRDFWSRIKGNSRVSPGDEEAWFAQSRRYSLSSLLDGLETLGGVRMDAAALAASRPPIRLRLLASALDPLAPMPADAAPRGSADGPPLAWSFYPAGHLPFLDFPGTMRPLLAEGTP